jgi:hypothetical protein
VKQLCLEVIQSLPGEFVRPITILPWWREALEAIDNPSELNDSGDARAPERQVSIHAVRGGL